MSDNTHAAAAGLSTPTIERLIDLTEIRLLAVATEGCNDNSQIEILKCCRNELMALAHGRQNLTLIPFPDFLWRLLGRSDPAPEAGPDEPRPGPSRR